MASPRSPSLDRGALSHVLGMESLATSASAAAATSVAALSSSTIPTTVDDNDNNITSMEHDNNGNMKHSSNNNIAKLIEDRSKNWAMDTNTDTDMDKESGRQRHHNSNNNSVHHHAVASGKNGVVPHSTKTASSSSAVDSSSQRCGLLHKGNYILQYLYEVKTKNFCFFYGSLCAHRALLFFFSFLWCDLFFSSLVFYSICYYYYYCYCHVCQPQSISSFAWLDSCRKQ